MVLQNINSQMDLEDLTMNWMDLDLVPNFDESQRVLVDEVGCKTQEDELLHQNLSSLIGTDDDDGCEDLPVLSTGPMDLMDFESFLSSPNLLRIESDENSSTSFSTCTSESMSETVAIESRFWETLYALETSMKRSQETRRRLSSKFVHVHTFQNALSSVESSTQKLHECFFCNKKTSAV
jgi:hypothetical protein